MFDTDPFIAYCRAAVAEQNSHMAVKELVACAVSDLPSVIKGLGEPIEAGVNELFVSDKLTVLKLIWGPKMTLKPHDHKMWAVIGIYTGCEDNIFWRKIKDDPTGRTEAASAEAIGAGDCAPLGKDVVHSVTNPIPRLTRALHVYGGDFFGYGRSEWDPETLNEQPFNMLGTIQLFEESNSRLSAA